MSSWSQWISEKTYSAGSKLAETAAEYAADERWQEIKEQAAAVAVKVGEGAAAAATLVEETTADVASAASVMAERRLHQTNIALLESDLESALHGLLLPLLNLNPGLSLLPCAHSRTHVTRLDSPSQVQDANGVLRHGMRWLLAILRRSRPTFCTARRW